MRQTRRRILVLCEGVVSEPEYLLQLARHHRNPLVSVKIVREPKVPLPLVRRAVELQDHARAEARRQRDDNLAYDEVWCVVDVDRHPHLPEARELAAVHGIELAISNPCFELWLWLHLRPSPGSRSSKELVRLLRRAMPSYDKHVLFEELEPGYAKAVTRAQDLDRAAEEDGEAGRNPTTGVYRLTESIRRS